MTTSKPSWKTPADRPRYRRWLLGLALVLGVAAFFGWPRVKARYHRWMAGRQVRQAAESIAHGDFRHAIIEARSALEANPIDSNAMRTMAQALEGAGSPANAAQWRSRFDSVVPGDKENMLAWASDSVKAGDVTAAERILGLLPPGARDSAMYHEVSAKLALAKHDSAAAEQHWAEASRLDPQASRYRLPLEILRLRSKDATLREKAVAFLTETSHQPPESIQALRALLADATRRAEWPRAKNFADALVADPAVTFDDKLARLGTLRNIQSLESVAYLSALREEAVAKPADLYLLLMWMNQHELALLVSDWSRTLPADIAGAPPTCVAIADAYVRSLEWDRLKEFLDDRPWGEWDYMRRAFLARAQERLEEKDLAAQEWKDGLSAARSRSDAVPRLERMIRLAIGWGWDQRAQEVMWSIAAAPGCPRWVLDALWLIAIESRDAEQLQKLAGILVQVDSKSVVFRNHFAFFSLLTRSGDGRPQTEAAKLFQENPNDVSIALTQALSLYQQGKFDAAVAITSGLPAAELRKPQVALYHAIFLTATGEKAKADPFRAAAETWKMYPEEKAMLARAEMAAAKAREDGDLAAAFKLAKAARAARDLETDQAVEAARAKRARSQDEALTTKEK